MKKISVIIVDDHPFFRQGVCLYFDGNEKINIIKDFEDGNMAIKFLEKKNQEIDVVIMDLQMPGIDGGEATRKICQTWPAIKVLVLTSYGNWDKIHSLLNSGASGYLLKEANPEELATAIEAVHNGGSYFSKKVAKALVKNVHQKETDDIQDKTYEKENKKEERQVLELIEPLTDREVEVLKLIGKGLGNSDIADNLFISENTVKTHVSNIFQKLNVNSRTQAAFYALQEGLI